jgi:hypothetical protein
VGTPVGVRVIDLDLDGLPDILFASQPGSLAALKNLGSSPARFNFRRQDTPLPGINVTSLDVGDFDSDGDIDAVVGGTGAGDAGTPGGVAVLLTNNVR